VIEDEDETNWFSRIPSFPREAALAIFAVLLVVAPFLLLERMGSGCGPSPWLFPASQFLGGATIFAYSQFFPVRIVGCLTMLASLPTAFIVALCGV
jgi:hypothetical protein